MIRNEKSYFLLLSFFVFAWASEQSASASLCFAETQDVANAHRELVSNQRISKTNKYVYNNGKENYKGSSMETTEKI